MRPVIIINVRRMIDSGIDVERLIAVTNFFLEYTIKYAMVPGAIEAWTCIFDLKDVGVTEIPKDRIQPLVDLGGGFEHPVLQFLEKGHGRWRLSAWRLSFFT